jgi:pantoate--beta-alanine ligase
LTNTLEGALREGHFDGVVQVVRRLLEIVTCQKAYFGEKDFQQLAVIRHMVKLESIPTEIVAVSTIRETNGLAMSSRNRQLSDSSRLAARAISKALYRCSELSSSSNLLELKREAIQSMKEIGIEPEYFEIINPDTFEVLLSLENQKKARVVTAAFVGEIRLIDNVAVVVTEANRISEPQPH